MMLCHIVAKESWMYSDFNDGVMNQLPVSVCHHGATKGDGVRFPPDGKRRSTVVGQTAGRRVLSPLVEFQGFGLRRATGRRFWRHRDGRKGRRERGTSDRDGMGWDALYALHCGSSRSKTRCISSFDAVILYRPSSPISYIPN